jgi:plasmid stabilization system protein ParE
VLESPAQFPEVEPGIRRALARRFPFAVYFLDEADAVVVLAVLHVRRSPPRWR